MRKQEQTQSQIQIFANKEFGRLEVWMVGGKAYFPATECAKTLGYSNPQKAVRDHCLEDGCTNRSVIDSLGRKQEKKYISEGNLYRLITRSKLPDAVCFERFVFDEVMPSIRAKGCYVTDELRERLAASEEEMSRFVEMLVNERNEKSALERRHIALREDLAGVLAENSELKDDCEFLESEIDELLPSAAYCDTILMCKDAIPVTVIASSYGLTAVAFNRLLHELKIIRKVGGTWVLYAKYNDCGYTVFRTYQISENKSARHLYWTEKGRHFLYEMLGFYGFLPEVERS